MKNEPTKRIISSIILVPLTLFFIVKGSFFFNFFISFCFLVTMHEWYQMSKKKNYFFFGLLFLIFSFYSVYLFRENKNFVFFLLVILICIFTDIGGYIFGKIFKGPKLIKISPNKTYAGMIGGFFLSIFISYIFLTNTSKISNNINLGFGYDYFFGFRHFLLTLLISLISQIGDLIISYFKRISKIKNTGKIIPGHGGILDRIDGMIFAFPITYFLLLELIY